jgi:EAL and modified HD-GYP domain-containing signal transduction protein
MLRWLSRLWSGEPAAPAKATSVPAPAAPPVGVDTPSAKAFGVRRPLIGANGALAGFELRFPPLLEQRLATMPPEAAEAASVAHHIALLGTARLTQQPGRLALVSLPGRLLDKATVAQQAVAEMLLLPLGPPAGMASLQALRQRGVRLGVPDGPPDGTMAADFVLLRAAAGGIDTLLLSAQRWREAKPGLRLVAVGLESIDDVERALASGFSLAGGRLEAGQGEPRPRPLQSAAHRICGLLNDLAMDRDTAVVAESVRSDVALSYRLLRYANSPAIGASRAVETVESAVMLLGRAEVGRWLSVMLMSAASGRQASAALQEDALARGRLLELLAKAQGVAQPQLLFTIGLLSRLHLLLQMPLAAALEPLRLTDESSQALLNRLGPWAGYLDLADELERDDEQRFGELCAPHGGIDAVLAVAAEAWGWAAEVVRASRGG